MMLEGLSLRATRSDTRTSDVLRRLIAGSLAAVMTTAALPASADVQACVAASEKGQRARSAGKLREAREHFTVCGAESCPALVRNDCAHWNAELASILPSVVFGARDKQGRDLFDVTVSMDGEVLLNKLDGKSVTVDPGKHTFRFEMAGAEPITEVVLIKEGERARVFNVTFDIGGSPPVPEREGPAPSPSDTTDQGHTPYPWIVFGIGAAGTVAGAVILLTTPERPSNCSRDTQTCSKLPNQSEAEFVESREQAGRADSQPVLGLVVGGVGLALAVTGLVWHFLEPTGHRTGARVTPWTTGASSGLSFSF
jgi:hypothetical protein